MNAEKFHPPRQGMVLHRERLINRLLSWEDRKLVLILGQAGQGKSTLASEYVRSLTIPSVWHNMNREEDDPFLFIPRLAQVLQRTFPAEFPRLPSIPRTGLPEAVPELIGRWITRILARLSRPCLIVLDDLNSTSSPPGLMRILKMLAEETPAHIRIMILSRTRPELDIAGLRAKRGAGEITGNDLRFSDNEAHELYSSVFGMNIGLKEAALINRKAEGWPAGLVLLHEYLSSLEPGAWSHALTAPGKSGCHTHIFDYLAQEVFSQLPGDLRRFLLVTSVADYLPLPLMEKLWSPARRKAGPPVSAVVDQLRARNLFVSALDDQSSAIRYHSLFRDFLRKKLLDSAGSSEIIALHSAAASYFRRAEDHVRAIDLLIESKQFEKALRWIESCVPELIAAGQTGTALRWEAVFPPSLRKHPWFLLSRAVSCRFTDPEASLSLFDIALRRFRAEDGVHSRAGQALALCGIIEGCFHTGGDFPRMANYAAKAQKLLEQNGCRPESSRARLLLAMGMAWFFTGRLTEGTSALLKALELFRSQQDHFSRITCAIYLAPCALYQGDFRLAREALRQGFESQAAIPDEAGGKAALLLTTAMTALFEGNFSEARESIDQCREMTDLHALQSIGFLSLDIEGWLMMAQGDYAAAERLLAECKHRGREAKNAFFSASAAHLLSINYLLQHKLGSAARESRYALSARSGSGSRLFGPIYRICEGAILFKRGRLRQAEKELRAALTDLRKIKAVQQEANAHLILALLYEKLGKQTSFLKHLAAGFSIGQERRFTYYAVLRPEELNALARKALGEGICAGYCEALLNGAAAGGQAAPRLTIRSLGGFRVFRGRTPIPDSEWKSKRARTLYKLLIARDDHKLPRELAMETLWPGKASDALPSLFSSMLHRARKTLEPDAGPGKDVFCIQMEGDLIALNEDRVRTDVREFRFHLKQAECLKSAGRSGELLKEYERIIDLYKGDFLPEDLYAEWSAGARDLLRAQYLSVLEAAGTLADSIGENNKALQLYEKMFLADSCSEKACRWLMAQYAATGRRNEAIRTYERCERALSSDMDLEPDEDTRKLYRSIIGG